MSESKIGQYLAGPDIDQLHGRKKPTLVPASEYWKHGGGLIVIFILLFLSLLYGISLLECTACALCPSETASKNITHVSCIDFVSLAFLCAITGAIGATIHSMTSFAIFAGKRKLAYEWMWWIYLRIPIGILLSMLVFLAMVSNIFGDFDSSKTESIFFVTLACGLAGLFSKQVTQKLNDILNIVFGFPPGETAENEDHVDEDEHLSTDAPAHIPSLGPDNTIQIIQERLIKLGYLDALRPNGKRFDDGDLGPVTRSAIDRFLEAEELVGSDRIDTLGFETDPDYWTHLLSMLDDAQNRK